MKIVYLLILVAVVLNGCGDSNPSTNDSASGDVLNGQFIDVGPVDELAYRTDSITGVTNATGQFEYLSGEQIVFSISAIELPVTNAQPIITALDIFSTSDSLSPGVVNLNRLLFTLDTDGQIDNGIQISDFATSATAGFHRSWI
ncbi:MAG: hypothetical protein ACI9UN_003194 [Granulosicoccus sp.]|jgi:hypothetical protein